MVVATAAAAAGAGASAAVVLVVMVVMVVVVVVVVVVVALLPDDRGSFDMLLKRGPVALRTSGRRSLCRPSATWRRRGRGRRGACAALDGRL